MGFVDHLFCVVYVIANISAVLKLFEQSFTSGSWCIFVLPLFIETVSLRVKTPWVIICMDSHKLSEILSKAGHDSVIDRILMNYIKKAEAAEEIEDRELYTLHAWFNRKRRRNGPLLYNRNNYKSNFYRADHPSKYSSYTYIQGLGKEEILEDKLILGSKKEKDISDKELAECLRLDSIDLDSTTINQIRNIINERGIKYTGKKTDLLVKLKELRHKMMFSSDIDDANSSDESNRIIRTALKKEQPEQEVKKWLKETEEINFMSYERFYF